MSIVIKHNTKLWERKGATVSYFLLWCPACGFGHVFEYPRWSFNGNLDKPTFTPSLRIFVRITKEVDDKLIDTGEIRTVCHFNLVDGQLQYAGDNPHQFNSQIITMQDIPENYGF